MVMHTITEYNITLNKHSSINNTFERSIHNRYWSVKFVTPMFHHHLEKQKMRKVEKVNSINFKKQNGSKNKK